MDKILVCMLCDNVFKTKQVNYVCKSCHRYLVHNLGGDYYKQPWYIEAVKNWQVITRGDKKYYNMVAFYISPYREIRRELENSSIVNVIQRLVYTYGHGSRMIHDILKDTYKCDIPERTIERFVNEFKQTKPEGNEEREAFWRRWHRELRRLEKELHIAT